MQVAQQAVQPQAAAQPHHLPQRTIGLGLGISSQRLLRLFEQFLAHRPQHFKKFAQAPQRFGAPLALLGLGEAQVEFLDQRG